MFEVDELEKTISVASRDPAYYVLDEVELSRRQNWTGSARNQVFLYVFHHSFTYFLCLYFNNWTGLRIVPEQVILQISFIVFLLAMS